MGRLMRRRSTTTDVDAAPPAETAAERRCARLRDAALSRNVRVRFVLDEIGKLGCDVGAPATFVRCAGADRSGPLGGKMTGGFAVNDRSQKSYAPGVIAVAEHAPDKAVFERTLVHELIHAYDQCRAKVDWRAGAHHACAEIRASSLSGECDLSQEVNRGKWGLTGHHGACVKRRAALSLALSGRAEPEATVDAVFARCYADTAPFERHPDFAGLSRPWSGEGKAPS